MGCAGARARAQTGRRGRRCVDGWECGRRRGWEGERASGRGGGDASPGAAGGALDCRRRLRGYRRGVILTADGGAGGAAAVRVSAELHPLPSPSPPLATLSSPPRGGLSLRHWLARPPSLPLPHASGHPFTQRLPPPAANSAFFFTPPFTPPVMQLPTSPLSKKKRLRCYAAAAVPIPTRGWPWPRRGVAPHPVGRVAT